MFRKGGLSQETGIMSGLDSPRRSYAGGGNIGGGSISGNLMGSRTGFLDPQSAYAKGWNRIYGGGKKIASEAAEKVAQTGWKGKAKTAWDAFKKAGKWTKGGIGSMLSYAPAGVSTPGAGYSVVGGGAIAGPMAALAAVPASVIAAQLAAKKQRKKGMYTPEGETYDPETGRITSSQNVDELGFTEQELAGSDAHVPGRNLTPAEMKEARADKLKELQKEQISARIKRGDPVSANTAQELGVSLKTGEYDKGGKKEDPTIDDKFTGDMESDLMKAYKEYAPIFEKELGVSPEDTKKQLYMQLAEFGRGYAEHGDFAKAAEKPIEKAGEVVKDVSTAKRQAKLLALQTAISENQPGNVGKALKDIAKAYKVSMAEAADIYAKWQTNNTTALAADVRAYREFAEAKGVNPEGFQSNIRKLLADPDLADLVGKFNEVLPEDIEDATNKEYYITTQGDLVRVVDGEILTSKDAGFKDKPKEK